MTRFNVCESTAKNYINKMKDNGIYYSGKKKGCTYKENTDLNMLSFIAEKTVIFYALIKELLSF